MLYKWFRNILFMMEPEHAHETAMDALVTAGRIGLGPVLRKLYAIAEDPVDFTGLTFKNRIGLAAGFDKNARWLHELSWLGFGHIEAGTVTPVGQPGNDKPRLFRLKPDQALINRMGFNNDGVEVFSNRLHRRPEGMLVGGNIGKNKVTPNEEAHLDYIKCLEKLYMGVDFFTVNISSPNTPGLRTLQDRGPLEVLLKSVKETRESQRAITGLYKPIYLKIAPDLSKEQAHEVVALVMQYGLDAMVVSNTTISRSGLKSPASCIAETGGLSGKPVQQMSDDLLKYIYQATSGNLPLIGVGGVFNREDYLRKIDCGASLVQVYTGFIYEGPGIVKNIYSI